MDISSVDSSKKNNLHYSAVNQTDDFVLDKCQLLYSHTYIQFNRNLFFFNNRYKFYICNKYFYTSMYLPEDVPMKSKLRQFLANLNI